MEPGRLHCAEPRKCLFIPATLTAVALHAAGGAWREVCGRVATIVPFWGKHEWHVDPLSLLSLRFLLELKKKREGGGGKKKRRRN